MNIYSKKAILTLKNETTYLSLIIILVPLMNFLSGIVLDLYAPSLPAIALNFHTTAAAAKNTMTAAMLGVAIGCLLWGMLFDTWGRRKIIITALIIFIISSFMAPFCHSISQLMVIRFIQGLMTAAMAVGSRTIVADHFTGQRFVVAVMYTSLAYGLGPVIGPFIGGYIQYQFGWEANFYAFTLAGIIMLVLFSLFVHERFNKTDAHTFSKAISFYKTVITDKTFLFAALLFGLVQLGLMIYPILGPFLVEHQLNYSPVTYGNTALIVGLGYLLGTLSNRILLKTFLQANLIKLGFVIFGFACLAQLIFIFTVGLNLFTLVFPITLIGYAIGFIYGNLLANCLKLFPENVGITSSFLAFSLMLLSSLGIFAVSYIKIDSLYGLFYIFLIVFILKVFIYTFYIKARLFKQSA